MDKNLNVFYNRKFKSAFKMKKLLLFFLLNLIAFASTKTDKSLLERLSDAAKSSLKARIQSNDDLKKFQIDLLKKRNSQCVTYEDLTNKKFDAFENIEQALNEKVSEKT